MPNVPIILVFILGALSSGNGKSISLNPPRLTTFAVETSIQFRYARTSMRLEAENPSTKPQQFPFSLTLPETAFVMNMTLTYNNTEHVARVEKKEIAEKQYQEAVTAGNTAAQVKGTVRDAQKVSIDVNIEPGEKVVLVVSYEELLERKVGRYEYSANINPGSVVDNFTVTVRINESRPIKDLLVPDISLNSNDIASLDATGSGLADVQPLGDYASLITYTPSRQDQETFGSDGITGKFVVEYDVERLQDNIIQVMDGYFVHFFAPDNEKPLPKHVIFVLDTSGSMLGTKLVQLKNAMVTILDEVTADDYLSIISFSDNTIIWKSTSQDSGSFAVRGVAKVRNEASRYILQLKADGGTNINNALLDAVKVADNLKLSGGDGQNVTPIIVFLTDGEATTGETVSKNILRNVKTRNIGGEVNVPIFSLAFGSSADFKLLRDISLENLGFAKKIYEGTDASIQLEGFYQTIATPLLKNVKFEYVGDIWERDSLSQGDTPTFFMGSEAIVVGKLSSVSKSNVSNGGITVVGEGANGNQYVDRIIELNNITDVSTASNINFMERLWAYKTIKRLLSISPLHGKVNNSSTSEPKDPRKEATDLSLKYNFVTELTSLIVTKPGEKETEVKPVPVSTDAGNRFHGVLTSIPASFSGGTRGTGFFLYDDAVYEDDDYYGTIIVPLSANGGIQVNSIARPRPPSQHPIADYDYYDIRPSQPFNDGGIQVSGGSIRPAATTTTITKTTTITTTTTTTTTTTFITTPLISTSTSCTMTLYDKTYNRGDSVTFTEDLENIGTWDNRLVSLRIDGGCCWRIFTEESYGGRFKDFCRGVYNSATDMDFLFKDASSIKIANRK